ncbi:DUF3421 domain-containing protein [Legionella jordanis]|nr:DUF3421 domain-containing protein [Legionella jordanis]
MIMVDSKKMMVIFFVLGLLLGFVIDIFYVLQVKTSFYYITALLFFLSYGLTYNGQHNLRLIVSSLLLALLLASPFIALDPYRDYTLQQLSNHLEQLVSFLIGFPLMAYIGHCFHYSYHRDGLQISYNSLFAAVWDSFVALAAATVFFGFAKLLIILAATLFKSVGNNVLWSIYYESFESYFLIHSTLFFVGLGIVRQQQKALHDLRYLLLRMMQFLLPLLALISVLYSILYLVSAKPISHNWLAPEALLISLVVLGIIFFNAYFQTGSRPDYRLYGLELLIKVYRICLLLLCLSLCYQILTHNILPLNFVLYLLTALLYCFFYAITVFLPHEAEIYWLITANKGIALFFLLAMLIINNPIHPFTAKMDLLYQASPVLQANSLPFSSSVNWNNQDWLVQTINNIDKNLNQEHFFWTKDPSPNSFIGGYSNHKPVYICRAVYRKGFQIAAFKDNHCLITYAGRVFPVKDYQILSVHGKTKVFWAPATGNSQMLALGAEPAAQGIRTLYACRTWYKGQLYIGKVVAGHCNIAIDRQEVLSEIHSVLSSSLPLLHSGNGM